MDSKPQAAATLAFWKDMECQNFGYLLYVELDDYDDNWDGQCMLGTVG